MRINFYDGTGNRSLDDIKLALDKHNDIIINTLSHLRATRMQARRATCFQISARQY